MDQISAPQTPRKRWLHFRALTSFVVTFAFVAMAGSGAVLFAAPRGRDANWSGWTVLGLSREHWVALHLAVTALFLVFGLAHLAYNWRTLWGYVRLRLRRGINLWKELLLAVLLVAGLSAGTIMGLPPSQTLVLERERIKDYWTRTLPRAPMPHAEMLTLEDLQQRCDVPAEHLTQALRDRGLSVGGPGDSLARLAEDNDTTPAAVFDVLSSRFAELGRLSRPGRGGGRGRMRGRQTTTEP